MTEFERGVRFVLERTEAYTKADGPAVTQFGDYQMTMVETPAKDLLQGSADLRERRVQAILDLGMRSPRNAE